jgi:hypothetical protein
MRYGAKRPFVGGTPWLLMVALSVSCGARTPPDDPRLGPELELREFTVAESGVFRAALFDQGGGFSSGDRMRNILFIDPSGQSRWLRPDHAHVIVEHPIGRSSPDMLEGERPVAIAALVRPASPSGQAGQLLILDPTGRTIVTVADNVSDVLGVALSESQDPSILYWREDKYVLATFARTGLAKIRDTVVSVPELK